MRGWRLMLAAAAAALALSAGAAHAACKWNGQLFPVGAVVGSLVCTPSGWKPR
jgi:hypothetical protein